MKASKLLFLLTVPFLLASCGGDEDTSSGSYLPDTGSVPVTLNGMLIGGVSYNETFAFSDTYFEASATEPNKDLRLLSFASSLVASDSYLAQKFYSGMHFDNYKYAHYDEITEDTIGYFFSHKKMGDTDLVGISIRGFDYKLEWANNLLIGKEGNHKGFSDKANEIYDALKTYVADYQGKLKIWVSGYSRAGAVANTLASKLLKERNEISVTKDDLFVYTFEAPRSLTKDNAVAYENVFNYVSSSDLIANLLPEQYGLYRCGKEIALNEEMNVDVRIESFVGSDSLPKFTPSEGNYANEKEFLNYVIGNLLDKLSDPAVTMDNRESFANNYQSALGYFFSMYFYSNSVTSAINSKFRNTSQTQILTMIDNNELYEFIKPVLDIQKVDYESTRLDVACDALGTLVKAKKSFVIDLFTDGAKLTNLRRSIAMHYPDVTYAIIK